MYMTPQNRRFARLTSAMLVSCVIYQIGACPCGCLEHNYWLGLAGFVDHHESIVGASATAAVAGTHEDDCLDHHPSPYVNTTRRVEIASDAVGNSAVSSWYLTSTLRLDGDFRLDRGPSFLGNSPRCDTLQVFRL